ncbi:MAG: tetratricopeptide repeat protein [Thermoanaerobaculia bacterium]|nr:tetratricopeptide repeat protein [Thermoanaerobaculia bacterium]
MNRRLTLATLAAALILSACAGSTPPPVVTPQGDDRYLIDPRTTYTGTSTEWIDRRFNTAWSQLLSGQTEEARKRFNEILNKDEEYLPAQLGLVAAELKQGRPDIAGNMVMRVVDRAPKYTAARVYEAEVAIAEGQRREALEIYRAVASAPNAPETAGERVRYLERTLFEELMVRAQAAPESEAIGMLREALTINATDTNARLLLTQKLIAEKSWDEARRVLEPLVNSGEVDRPEVQESLAEIDAGRGRYQEAIVRYERLSRRTRDARHEKRLAEIKDQWTALNMPPQYQAAIESTAINRADFAVLLYWRVASVRFAQNLSTPPIAIDIADIAGREEIIRAIAIGLYDVDPVTRRVAAARPLTAASASRLATRLLMLRSAPCARGLTSDQVLSACGIKDPAAGVPADELVSGRAAVALMDQLDKALR